MPWWWKKPEQPTKVKIEESAKLKKPKVKETEDERPLRTQLIEARGKLRREIEILESPTGIGRAPDCREERAALAAELREIEDALTNLGPDES
ncbi:MAG TPA: hypothetical protein VGP48_10310 [Stellaceae bacterium]|jgi:hypothetical protein|nr:hypothetical protein [Stellaceae bacterium]